MPLLVTEDQTSNPKKNFLNQAIGHGHPGGGILRRENTGRGFEYFDDNLVIMFEALVVSVELEL